ncbi:unnamed protein product [Rangifer tarandus platyrhynchus]|uniref:Uncharacterized protein n=1 Tax=Rangifer tarandus platyrhynchus TaxID=3082113 RepID=A0AC59YYJ3_RANTA
MIRWRSSRSSPARHRAAASPAPCRESGAHPLLAPACRPPSRVRLRHSTEVLQRSKYPGEDLDAKMNTARIGHP